jgi:hypothetical protein
MTKQKEQTVFSGLNNIKVAFAYMLQRKLMAEVEQAKKDVKVVSIWDKMNHEYIQDLSCIVTDIVFETISIETFSENEGSVLRSVSK